MALHHLIAAAEPTAAGTGVAATIVAILASSVIVLGGLAALVRALWKTATILRDNTMATAQLTEQLREYTKATDSRFENLVDRVTILEKHGA